MPPIEVDFDAGELQCLPPNLTGALAQDGILVVVTSVDPSPVIGVTTYRQVSSWWAWERDAAVVPGNYLDAVEAAGGQPLLIPPRKATAVGVVDHCDGSAGLDRFEAVVGVVDGLLLIGGGDIDAGRYGKHPDQRNAGADDQRDDLEFGLLGMALRHGVPVLAVCRGIQVLNVSLGGDLVQHLPDLLGSDRHQPRPGAFGSVSVTTTEGSTVHRLLGGHIDVLCSHHQAIGSVGRGLVVTARGDDGVIEAVEMPDRQFVVGVQWHPEETGDARLFEALVVAAAAARRDWSSASLPDPARRRAEERG